MKQPNLYDLIELLESLESLAEQHTSDTTESSHDCADEQCSDSKQNFSAHEAIDRIIEGTLNTFIELNAFPTPEQVGVLQELRILQMSYEG